MQYDIRQSNYRRTYARITRGLAGSTIVSEKTFHGCAAITRRVSQTTTLRFRAPAPLMDICITVKPQMLQLWNNEIVRGAGVRYPRFPLSTPATPTAVPRWCQLTPTSRALTWYRCFVELTTNFIAIHPAVFHLRAHPTLVSFLFLTGSSNLARPRLSSTARHSGRKCKCQ